MSEMRELLWKVVELGARTGLRKHGFKRPGGGSRLVRERHGVGVGAEAIARGDDLAF